jgi:hypothetical protein
MGKYNDNPITIFKKECIKIGILDSVGEDNDDIIDLLTQTFDENNLEGKIKKAKSEYAKRKFKVFCRKRFRLLVENSFINSESDTELKNRISKTIQDIFDEYQANILNANTSTKEIIAPKEIREKVFKEVKLSQDVPEFIGEDMRAYGPYKKGEIVSIPLRNAEILIREKVAES